MLDAGIEPPGLTATPTASTPTAAPAPTADPDGVLEQSDSALGKEMASGNAANSVSIGGTYRARIRDVTVPDGITATATVCSAYRDATFADVDGPDTPEQAGMDVPKPYTYSLPR